MAAAARKGKATVSDDGDASDDQPSLPVVYLVTDRQSKYMLSEPRKSELKNILEKQFEGLRFSTLKYEKIKDDESDNSWPRLYAFEIGSKKSAACFKPSSHETNKLGDFILFSIATAETDAVRVEEKVDESTRLKISVVRAIIDNLTNVLSIEQPEKDVLNIFFKRFLPPDTTSPTPEANEKKDGSNEDSGAGGDDSGKKDPSPDGDGDSGGAPSGGDDSGKKDPSSDGESDDIDPSEDEDFEDANGDSGGAPSGGDEDFKDADSGGSNDDTSLVKDVNLDAAGKALVKKLTEEKEAADKAFLDQQSLINLLSSRKTTLEDDLNAAKKELEDAKKALADLAGKLQTCIDSNSAKDADIDNKVKEITAKESEIAALTNSLATTTIERDTAKAEERAARDQAAAIKLQLDSLSVTKRPVGVNKTDLVTAVEAVKAAEKEDLPLPRKDNKYGGTQGNAMLGLVNRLHTGVRKIQELLDNPVAIGTTLTDLENTLVIDPGTVESFNKWLDSRNIRTDNPPDSLLTKNYAQEATLTMKTLTELQKWIEKYKSCPPEVLRDLLLHQNDPESAQMATIRKQDKDLKKSAKEVETLKESLKNLETQKNSVDTELATAKADLAAAKSAASSSAADATKIKELETTVKEKEDELRKAKEEIEKKEKSLALSFKTLAEEADKHRAKDDEMADLKKKLSAVAPEVGTLHMGALTDTADFTKLGDGSSVEPWEPMLLESYKKAALSVDRETLVAFATALVGGNPAYVKEGDAGHDIYRDAFLERVVLRKDYQKLLAENGVTNPTKPAQVLFQAAYKVNKSLLVVVEDKIPFSNAYDQMMQINRDYASLAARIPTIPFVKPVFVSVTEDAIIEFVRILGMYPLPSYPFGVVVIVSTETNRSLKRPRFATYGLTLIEMVKSGDSYPYAAVHAGMPFAEKEWRKISCARVCMTGNVVEHEI